MNLQKHIQNNYLKIKVIPNSSRTELTEENGSLKLYLKSPPEKDKANLELLKFFKKEFNLKVVIKSGRKGREKLLEIRQ